MWSTRRPSIVELKMLAITGEAFKFLGKGLLADLSNSWHKESLKRRFDAYATLIDGTLLTGIQKAWIWEHFAIAKFSSGFLISDFLPRLWSLYYSRFRPEFSKSGSGWLGEQIHRSCIALLMSMQALV